MDPIADFIAITECGSEDIAIHYLSASDFNLDDAMSLYASDRAAEGRPTNFATNAIPVDPARAGRGSSLSRNVDSGDVVTRGLSSSPITTAAAVASPLSSSSTLPLSASPTPGSLLESGGGMGMLRANLPSAPVTSGRGSGRGSGGHNESAPSRPPPHMIDKLTQEAEAEEPVGGARNEHRFGGFPTLHSSRMSPVLSNPFAGSENPTLARMFRTPSYVHPLDQPLAAVCEKASRADQWILIALCDGFFASVALTSSLWNTEAMQALGSSLACYVVDVRTDDGRQLAQGFGVDQRDLPRLFLVDPITSHCEQEIQTRRNAQQSSDGAAIVNDILQFMADYGSPHQYLESRQSVHSTAPSHSETSPNTGVSRQQTPSGAERPKRDTYVDVENDDDDEEEEVRSHRGRSASAERKESRRVEQQQQGDTVDVDDEEENVPEVSIDEWCVNSAEGSDNSSNNNNNKGSDVYRVRCRLPRQLLELSLRPAIPVQVLVRYLAYRVHCDDTATYRTPPPIILQSGFPPKQVVLPGGDVSLRDCKSFRSGDVIIVRPTLS